MEEELLGRFDGGAKGVLSGDVTAAALPDEPRKSALYHRH